jgi:hypothetical protein
VVYCGLYCEAKSKELNIRQDTFHNNEYNKNLSIRHAKQHKHNKNTGLQHQNTKWDILHIAEKKQGKS